jgi:dTMP kinase
MRPYGDFITFEGGDGSGKTTLIEGVSTYLKSLRKSLLLTRAPGGTPLGAQIRHLLLTQTEQAICHRAELLLFLADRAQHVDEVILPALQQGQIVLCDRFDDSTIAYQGARGFPAEHVKGLCQFATNTLSPSLTFYLDIDPRIGLARASKRQQTADRLESEALHFHDEVRKGFLHIAKQESQRVKVLDATKSPEEVLAEAKSYLNRGGLS